MTSLIKSIYLETNSELFETFTSVLMFQKGTVGKVSLRCNKTTTQFLVKLLDLVWVTDWPDWLPWQIAENNQSLYDK